MYSSSWENNQRATEHRLAYGIICQLTKVSVPALIASKPRGTWFAFLGGMEGWVDLDVGYTPRWFSSLQTVIHWSSMHFFISLVTKPLQCNPVCLSGTTLNWDGGLQSPVGHFDCRWSRRPVDANTARPVCRIWYCLITRSYCIVWPYSFLSTYSAIFTASFDDFPRRLWCRSLVDQFVPRQPHSVRPLSWIQVDSTTGVVWSPTGVSPGADTLSSIYSWSSKLVVRTIFSRYCADYTLASDARTRFVPAGSASVSLPPRLCTWLSSFKSSARVTPQHTS